MSVAGKIALGSGVAIVLLVGVLVWDLSVVNRLADSHEELSRVNFRAAGIALDQVRLLDQLDEFTRKYQVTKDPAYRDRLGLLRIEFAGRLREMTALDLPRSVRSAVATLAAGWDEYWREAMAFAGTESLAEEALNRLSLERLARVRGYVSGVGESAQRLVERQAASSLDLSRRTRKISSQVVIAALALSLVILWLTIRSINRPLSQLTKGTRAVAEGEFAVRLPTRGRDELSRLAGSFNQMVSRLGEAERVKKEFLSHVSHELKTPLASMQETNELLLEEIPGPLNEKQRRFLDLNLESSRRLSAMISKLLDLSRLEAGAMDYDMRRRDLAELCRDVVAAFEARALDQGVKVVLQWPAEAVFLICDRDRMIQVLENLLDNALKFSPRGGTVEVRVLPPQPEELHDRGPQESERADLVILEVADQGPGIAQEDRSKVFERFYQASADSSGANPHRGVGLGLAICREIVDAHGGEVWMRDGSNGGSVFAVAMPASRLVDEATTSGQEIVA